MPVQANQLAAPAALYRSPGKPGEFLIKFIRCLFNFDKCHRAFHLAGNAFLRFELDAYLARDFTGGTTLALSRVHQWLPEAFISMTC